MPLDKKNVGLLELPRVGQLVEERPHRHPALAGVGVRTLPVLGRFVGVVQLSRRGTFLGTHNGVLQVLLAEVDTGLLDVELTHGRQVGLCPVRVAILDRPVAVCRNQAVPVGVGQVVVNPVPLLGRYTIEVDLSRSNDDVGLIAIDLVAVHV